MVWKKSARKAEKADTQAVRDGSAARQRPSSRLQFTEEERAVPVLGKYIDRSYRAAEHHEKKRARKAEKANTQAVRDGSAARQRPSSRLQFTEEERCLLYTSSCV